MANCTEAWLSTEGVLDVPNGTVSEKTQETFRPTLPAEYMTVFSGRTDAPEVKCDLKQTQRQTDRTTTVTLLHIHVCTEG